jgi:hypothetical protein
MPQVKLCAASRWHILMPLSAALGTDALGRDVDIMIGTGQRDGVPRFMHFFQSGIPFRFIVI